jgi:hypothetical protein
MNANAIKNAPIFNKIAADLGAAEAKVISLNATPAKVAIAA